MAISTAKLAILYKHCADTTIKRIYRDLLIESLSDQHMQVYDFVAVNDKAKSNDIMAILDCNQNHAATILKRLHDYGLLSRRALVTTQGKEYEYYEGAS